MKPKRQNKINMMQENSIKAAGMKPSFANQKCEPLQYGAAIKSTK